MKNKTDAETLVNDVTKLLMDKGCTVNKPAMIELALYIAERERNLLDKNIKQLDKLAGVLDESTTN